MRRAYWDQPISAHTDEVTSPPKLLALEEDQQWVFALMDCKGVLKAGMYQSAHLSTSWRFCSRTMICSSLRGFDDMIMLKRKEKDRNCCSNSASKTQHQSRYFWLCFLAVFDSALFQASRKNGRSAFSIWSWFEFPIQDHDGRQDVKVPRKLVRLGQRRTIETLTLGLEEYFLTVLIYINHSNAIEIEGIRTCS